MEVVVVGRGPCLRNVTTIAVLLHVVVHICSLVFVESCQPHRRLLGLVVVVVVVLSVVVVVSHALSVPCVVVERVK